MHEITTVTRPGIPTAISIDHYGYVVPDLDQAVAFFTDVLGFELLSLDEPTSRYTSLRLGWRIAVISSISPRSSRSPTGE